MTVEHNPAVEAFLDTVCSHIKSHEVHSSIRSELRAHIDDAIEAALDTGLSDEEAINEALQSLGDPQIIGKELNRAHRPRVDWRLLSSVTLLAILGIWAMYAVEASGSSFSTGLLTGKMAWTFIGLLAGTFLYFYDYRRLQRWAPWLYGLTLAGVVIIFTIASPVAGSIPYTYVSATPILFLIALSGGYDSLEWGRRPLQSFAIASCLAFAPFVIYLSLPNIFAAFEYVVCLGVLWVTAKTKRNQLVASWGVALIGLFGLMLSIVMSPHRMMRLVAWLQPLKDPIGIGYQSTQSLHAIRGSSLWGQGATAALNSLPQIPYEFIFPYLVYSLGWVAGAGVVVLACFLVSRLWWVRARVRDEFGQRLLLVIALIFSLEIGWNLFMTVGLAPIASVGLPLVSYGARQALYMAAIGLALGVHRRQHLHSHSAVQVDST